MKRGVLISAVLFSTACLGAAGDAARVSPSTFTGTIHDNRCVGPNCAKQCPVKKGPVYTLQTSDAAWVLSDQRSPEKYNGKRVVVSGRVIAGNKIQVLSITPAQ
jgi:hypothetical protein